MLINKCVGHHTSGISIFFPGDNKNSENTGFSHLQMHSVQLCLLLNRNNYLYYAKKSKAENNICTISVFEP